MTPTLSAAMIVRDEADVLDECLATAREYLDEICVVDTGSVDATRDIARSFGVRLGHFAWSDDFSAARNASLEMCSGDWIFVLDADERLTPDDWKRLRALICEKEDKACRFVTRNYTDNDAICDFTPSVAEDTLSRGFRGWFPSAKVRLFPNGHGIRFEGEVHELVNTSVERAGLEIRNSDIPIHHYPFLHYPYRIQAKCEMYIRLGLAKLETNPDDPKAYAELGNQYAELKDYARAADAYRNALRFDSGNADVLSDLGGVLHLLGRTQEAAQALDIATRMNPALFQAWRNLGVVHAAQSAWREAVRCFEQAMRLNPEWRDGWQYIATAWEGGGELRLAADALMNAEDVRAFARAGMLYYRLGEPEKAAQARSMGLRLDPDNEELNAGFAGVVE